MAAPAVSAAESVCRQQSIWSLATNKLKRDLIRWRTGALALTITGQC